MAVKTVQAVINGTTVTLTYNSSTGKYEATVTAPSKSSYNVNSGHYYPAIIIRSQLRQPMRQVTRPRRQIRTRHWVAA